MTETRTLRRHKPSYTIKRGWVSSVIFLFCLRRYCVRPSNHNIWSDDFQLVSIFFSWFQFFFSCFQFLFRRPNERKTTQVERIYTPTERTQKTKWKKNNTRWKNLNTNWKNTEDQMKKKIISHEGKRYLLLLITHSLSSFQKLQKKT